MAETIELASTIISVGISTEGMGKSILSSIKGVASGVGGVGKKAGADFKQGFSSSSAGATKTAESDLKRLQSAVQTQAKKVRAARDQERDATRKLGIEEAKLEELRTSGKAKTSQLLAAEDRVEKARRAQAIATDKAETESRQLADAHLDLKRAQAASADEGHKSAAAALKAGNQTEQAATGIKGAWQKVKGTVQGINPFSKLPSQADKAGRESTGKLKSSMSAGVGKIGGILKSGLVAGIAAAGIAGAGQIVGDMVTAASNMEQSVGGVTAVFKGAASDMLAASKDAAQSVGLSSNAYNELATKLGSMLKNKGIKDFGGETKKLIGLGADLAAQFGGPTSDAVDALSALMRGERDPIEKYGVSFNEAAVQAEAFAMGLAKPEKNLEKIKAAQNQAIVAQRAYSEAVKKHGKNSDEALTAEARLAGANSRLAKAMEGTNPKLTDQQKAMASLSLVYKQTGDAQGAFGRENDTFAGKQQRAAAAWENLQAKIGGLFLPALTSAMGFLNDTAMPAIDGLVNGISGAGQAISGFFSTPPSPALTDAITGVQGAAQGMWNVVAPILDDIWRTIQDNWPAIQETAQTVWGSVQGIIQGVLGTVKGIIDIYARLFAQIWRDWGESITGIFTGIFKIASGIFSGFLKVVEGVWTMLSGILQGDTKKIGEGAKKILGGIFTAFEGLFKGAVDVLGGVWSGIKKVFSGPVNWVISNVLNPLIRAINGVAKAFGASFRVSEIGLVDGKAHGGIVDERDGYRRGGVLSGFTPVHRGDDRLVPMRSGEGVYVSEAMRDPYERARLREVNAAALAGRSLDPWQETGDVFGGLAKGGIVPNARQGFRGYNKSFLSRIKAWAGVTGRTWHMTGNGGARSFADQLRAWKLYKAGKGPLAANPYKGGPHMIPGNAMDLSPRPGQIASAKAQLGRFGLGLPVRGEPWHVGWKGGGRKGGKVTGGGSGSGSSSSDINDAAKKYLGKNTPGPLGSIMDAIPDMVVKWGKDKLKSILGFDQGGWLQPGGTFAVNQTGKPEAVLTNSQWDAVSQVADPKVLAEAIAHAFADGAWRVDIDNGQLFFDRHYSTHQRQLALDSHLAGRR